MANISIDDIRKLRSMTGAGMTEAKGALVASKGDFHDALKLLHKSGLTKVEKRAEREAIAGLIGTYSHDGKIGVVVEVSCETDFVARTDEFKDLVKDICLQIVATTPTDVPELLKQEFIKDTELTVGAYIKRHIAKLGENIVVRRFERLALGE